MKRIDYINSLPFYKQIIEVLKTALNFKIKIRNIKGYLEEDIEVTE